MDRFVNQTLSYIREHDLIRRGDAVTVGFSGGADSVCLLVVLCELKRLLGIGHLQAVHVNHGLRGAEAERDEAFCRHFAAEREIDFQSVRVDVRSAVREQGLSEEEAGRNLRYAALERLAGGQGLVAVAHHADDQAETILLNLLRGTGLRGMGGMRPRRGQIIRPLLDTGREEILAFLRERKLPYVEDSTNDENEHTRNRLRHDILPLLKAEVNARAAEHLAQTGALIGEADRYLAAEAAAYLDSMPAADAGTDADIDRKMHYPAEPAKSKVTHKGQPAESAGNRGTSAQADPSRTLSLDQKSLRTKAPILRRYILMEALRRLGVPLKDWGSQHFADMDAALFAGGGYHLDLPGGVHTENRGKQTMICVDA